MMEFWEKIAYMVELDAACLLFVLPAKKGNNCVIRISAGIILTLMIAYTAHSLVGSRTFGVAECFYRLSYIVFCIIFLAVCMDISWIRVVFCAFCACTIQHIAYDMTVIYRIIDDRNPWVLVLIYICVYILLYWIIVKRLLERGTYPVTDQRLFFPIATIIILVWFLSYLDVSGTAAFEAAGGSRIIFRIIDALCCFYVLWIQVYEKENRKLNQELAGINSAWLQQKKQYEVTSDIIDNISRISHDLKHQIKAVREMNDSEEKETFLNDIEREIQIYDTTIQTGNKALDTVLMDKGLFCKTHNIEWSCMADASRLDFMKLEDIYAIFGNALDNAITAVLGLEEPEKRVIDIKIIPQNSIVVIQIQNYYEGEIHFEEGLPLTTKTDKQHHGYGMKSIRYIAEKYNGTVTVHAKSGTFILQILLPLPK